MTAPPEWLIPVLTLLMGALGGYFGASRKVVVLETRMEDLLNWKKNAAKDIEKYNEDLMIHDIEIQRLCINAKMERASRQRYRGV